MTCTRINGGIICTPNIDGPYRIRVGKRVYLYIWDHMWGPWPVDKDEMPYKKQYFGEGYRRLLRLRELLEKRKTPKSHTATNNN